MKSAEKIIKKFGGPAHLARLLKENRSMVQYWKSKGTIPSKWQPKLLALARDRGVTLLPLDFMDESLSHEMSGKRPSSMERRSFSSPYTPPARVGAPRGLYAQEIKKRSETHLVFCFVGVGSAFSKIHDQTSLIIAKNRKMILVDVGATTPTALYRNGLSLTDFDYYIITHSHSDHIGGLEELLLTHRYFVRRKPKLIITPVYQKILWDDSLKGGSEINEAGLLRFSDLMDPIRPEWVKSSPREVYTISIDGMNIDIFRTMHTPGEVSQWETAFWSTGLMVDKKVLFTADTRFDPTLFTDLDVEQVETIFHDCELKGNGMVHAAYDSLKTLPAGLKNKMYLTHYGDNFKDFAPEKDGFLGFAQPFEMYTW